MLHWENGRAPTPPDTSSKLAWETFGNFYLFIYFWWYWSLNSGPHSAKLASCHWATMPGPLSWFELFQAMDLSLPEKLPSVLMLFQSKVPNFLIWSLIYWHPNKSFVPTYMWNCPCLLFHYSKLENKGSKFMAQYGSLWVEAWPNNLGNPPWRMEVEWSLPAQQPNLIQSFCF
jgi:hypothetical protein